MSDKKITRAQFEAIRTAELSEDNGAPSGDRLAGRYLISATTPTAAVLVRLGLAENITLTSAGGEFVFPVLTEVGELARKRIERDGDGLLPRVSSFDDLRRSVAAKYAPKPFTVVCDWDSDMFDAGCDDLRVSDDPQIFHVWAATGSDASDEADRMAVAQFGEETAYFLHNVAVLRGHAHFAQD
uniref:Uncharacterized protein n=1 Tax=Streptomyces sp. NBC_01393 TaxID=2903851 RepID=A0AAU3I7S4_9ACTN